MQQVSQAQALADWVVQRISAVSIGSSLVMLAGSNPPTNFFELWQGFMLSPPMRLIYAIDGTSISGLRG